MKPKHYIPLIIIALSTINSADAAISNQIPKAFAKAATQASSREAAKQGVIRLASAGAQHVNKRYQQAPPPQENEDSFDPSFILGVGLIAFLLFFTKG